MSQQPDVLCIDIGGTHTKLGFVDASGTIRDFRRIPTDTRGEDPQPYLNHLFTQLDAMIASADRALLLGIGISTAGEIDSARRRIIIAGNTPALRGIDLRGAFESRYAVPVTMNNDLTAHALGEYYYGCGGGVRRFMCLAVGTGVNAAVLVDGKPLIIDGGNSGNTGLIIIDPTGAQDMNGVRGSAEALYGVAGVERMAQARYGRVVSAYEVIAAAREGADETAVEIMRQVGTYIGQTLASLSVIFYPHRIAITGGTAAAGAALLDSARQQFDYLVGDFFRDIAANTDGHFQAVELVLGQGGETGLLGAAIELMQERGWVR